MKNLIPFLTMTVATCAVTSLSAAEISGKVKLKGTPPPEIQIKMDDACGKLQGAPPTTRHYIVGQDSGLGNVFVWIKEGAKPTPPKGDGPVLDQTSCMYQPYIFGVQTGQKFKIKNSDDTLHNVHALPKSNTEFNFGQPVKGMVTEKSFDKQEVLVKFKCDVHPWMFAYAGVVDHPYWAITDKDGNFTIKDVPAGEYTVEALHLKAGKAEQKLTLGADDKKALEYSLEVPAPK
jgi:plastocyanin